MLVHSPTIRHFLQRLGQGAEAKPNCLFFFFSQCQCNWVCCICFTPHLYSNVKYFPCIRAFRHSANSKGTIPSKRSCRRSGGSPDKSSQSCRFSVSGHCPKKRPLLSPSAVWTCTLCSGYIHLCLLSSLRWSYHQAHNYASLSMIVKYLSKQGLKLMKK